MTRPRMFAVAAACAVAALALAGCGGSPSDPGVATLGISAAGASPGATGAAAGRTDGLRFAQCMREHGVQMDDPVDGRIQIDAGPGQEAAIDAAQKACAQYAPDGGKGGPQLSQADRTRFLRYAQCMRDHGVPFQDPDFSGGGVKMLSPKGDAPVDQTKMQAADKACQELLPSDAGGGPSTQNGPDGGGPGTSTGGGAQ